MLRTGIETIICLSPNFLYVYVYVYKYITTPLALTSLGTPNLHSSPKSKH